MGVLETIRFMFGARPNNKPEVNAEEGYQKTLSDLLAEKQVQQAIAMLENRGEASARNLQVYHTKSHKIMSKPDKEIFDKNGNFIRHKPVNKIAIPYHQYINELALVFLYGKPVKWTNKSDDEQSSVKYEKYVKLLEECRFDAHIREAKRVAGCEGCSAMLFHTYQDNGKARMLIKVLSKEKNDDIYTLFDQYDQLKVFAWGYTTMANEKETIRHYDIYTAEKIYHCESGNRGKWNVTEENNLVGKIPAIVFIQEVEWDGAETIINRIEDAMSKNADTNDNFGDPALVATSDILNTLPKQEEESRLYVLRNGGDIKYLERSGNNQSRTDEIDRLDEQALNKTFTPNITIEELRGLANASGSTLKQVMMLANIKADKRKETHDGYLSRTSSLVLTIMERVLYIADGGYSNVIIGHEFQEPFGSDVSQILSDAIKQYGAGAMSLQTLLQQSYLIGNTDKEIVAINADRDEADRRMQERSRMDIFASAE